MLDGEITTEQYVEAMKKDVDRRLESDLERRMKLPDDRRNEPHTLTRIGRKMLGILTKQAAQ